mmetsp:Transcript_115420/g.368307  ORF Transcript_115420/g.368307 Transcript_115420/m.368307 type:complete len:221 (-) Transcript_115420:1091-1753(-)
MPRRQAGRARWPGPRPRGPCGRCPTQGRRRRWSEAAGRRRAPPPPGIAEPWAGLRSTDLHSSRAARPRSRARARRGRPPPHPRRRWQCCCVPPPWHRPPPAESGRAKPRARSGRRRGNLRHGRRSRRCARRPRRRSHRQTTCCRRRRHPLRPRRPGLGAPWPAAGRWPCGRWTPSREARVFGGQTGLAARTGRAQCPSSTRTGAWANPGSPRGVGSAASS